jgi:hypothetical protein
LLLLALLLLAPACFLLHAGVQPHKKVEFDNAEPASKERLHLTLCRENDGDILFPMSGCAPYLQETCM